jgi:Mn2+/Fe2+ NRAMP family transporter
MIIDKFTIQTQDSIAIARNKLISQIHDRSSLFRLRGSPSVLCGEVSEDTFSLCCVYGSGQMMTIINGWFEDVQSNTLVHLEVELNAKIIIFYLLAHFSFFTVILCGIKHPQVIPAAIISIVILDIVAPIYSCQGDIRFYRKKLAQVFL